MKSILKQYHYLYMITNLINGKFYIGIHSTNNIDDGYFGGGTMLNYAIKKYSKENFRKEIIEWFDWRCEIVQREIEIVNEKFIKRPDTYNIAVGGIGGNLGDDINIKSANSRKAFWANMSDNEYNKRLDNFRRVQSRPEVKMKLSAAFSKEHNPSYGKRWYHDAFDNEYYNYPEKLDLVNLKPGKSQKFKNQCSTNAKGEKNPMHRCGGHSFETRQKMKKPKSEAHRAALIAVNANPITINGIKYVSLREAAFTLKTTVYKIKKEAKCR